MLEHALPALSALSAQTAAFRSALAPADVAQITLARDIFQASWLVPLGLYFACEPPPHKWPITISWTIRKGTPKLAHHLCWLSGWTLFVAAVYSAGDPQIFLFLAAMFLTGFIGVIACPVGVSPLQDTIHWCASLLYIADHAVAFAILGTPTPYVAGFWACFALMATSYVLERRVRAAPPGSYVAGAAETAAQYGFMFGEYGLFICFLSGMASGLAT